MRMGDMEMANQTSKQGQGGRSGSDSPRQERGFAAMDPKQQREIASEGGRAAHEKGTAHEFTSEEARKAGRKGGEATAQQRQQANRSESGGKSGGGGSGS